MSKLSGGASYLTKESVPAKRLSTPKKSPVMVAISAFFALLFLFVSAQPLMASLAGSSSPSKAYAGSIGIFCTSEHLGIGMDDKSDWAAFLKTYPLPNEKNRVWTLQEAFGNGLSFVNYEGEGGKDKDLVVEKSPANTFKPGNYDAVSEKLNGVRNISSCAVPGLMSFVSNAGMMLASGFSNLVQGFVVFAFDSNIICDDPVNPAFGCLNLLKIIGGTGTDAHGGLIGTLTSSIYMPLLVIAVTITAFWVGYKGLVQRKLREAMFGAIWVCLSVIFGLALLLNPALLAKAPMAVSNSVASCVIGSFNGQNCMDGNTGTASLTTDNFSTSSNKICRSVAPGAALDEQMSMTVNSLSCTIWKAFVLEPYSQGSFGTSFESLDTIADTPTKKVIEKAGIDPKTFCVNLGSSESLESFRGKTAVFDKDTGKVCNLLAYQMFLQTNTSTTGSVSPESGKVDPRWYNIIVTAANDEGLWNQWAPSPTNSMHKNATATLAVITSLVGGFVLIAIAFFALVYYLTSVILMAFAPLFFLLGTHPGRGKKILLGWVEKVVSNVLKYLASAIFLIVSVTFYSAILGSATNPGLTFLFVIIISGALFMYRKEIVELIGKASMGGEQLSSKFADSLKDRAAGVGGLAMAGVGAGVGAKIAGGRVTSGIKAGIQRDLQRGGAKKIFGNVGGELVGNAARQFTRSTVDNERDVRKAEKDAESKAASDNQQLTAVQEEHNSIVAEIDKVDADFYSNTNDLEELNNVKTRLSEVEEQAARELMEDDQTLAARYFGQAELLMQQIAALEFDKAVALASGDTETADFATAQIRDLSSQRELMLNQVSTDELTQYRAEYTARVDDLTDRANINYSEEDELKRINLTKTVGQSQAVRDTLVERANELTEKRNELEESVLFHATKHESLRKTVEDIQPGDMVTKSKADKMVADSDKVANEASADAPVFSTIQHRDMDDVYRIQHEKMIENKNKPGNDSGPEGGSNSPYNGPDNRGPAGGSGSSGGTGGAAQNDIPRFTNEAPVTRTSSTQPVQSNSAASSTNADEERFERNRVERTQTARRDLDKLLSDGQNGNEPVNSRPSSTPEEVQTARRELDQLLASDPKNNSSRQQTTAPVRSEASTQPVANSSTPAPPARQTAIPTQPNRKPQIPTQPAQAPSSPAQQQSNPAPAEATPAPPAREPRIPTRPATSPSVPAQPVQPPQSSSTTPPEPTRSPTVPAQPDREPSNPMVRDRSNRGVPLAQEIQLPVAPQVSRVTENSPTPSVSINRAEQSDNQSGTQRGGIPRRRGPGNS